MPCQRQRPLTAGSILIGQNLPASSGAFKATMGRLNVAVTASEARRDSVGPEGVLATTWRLLGSGRGQAQREE